MIKLAIIISSIIIILHYYITIMIRLQVQSTVCAIPLQFFFHSQGLISRHIVVHTKEVRLACDHSVFVSALLLVKKIKWF